MPYIEKRIYSGDMLEVERYFASRGGRPKGSRNEQPTSSQQEALNDAQSWRHLWRMIHCNFSREAGDMCITLTFNGQTEEEEAQRAYNRFIRRMRAERKRRALPELKYIIIREEQSGRQHAHMLVNGGLSFEELSKLWAKGWMWGRLLDDTPDHKALARYLTEQHKQRKGGESQENAKTKRRRGKRRWTGSRNLQKPKVVKRECRPVTLKTMPRAPKGYELRPDFQRDADVFGNLWIKWTCRRIQEPKRTARQRRKRE